MAQPKACLDDNVLWSPQQRNLFLQFALQKAIMVGWSSRIEAEWLRNTNPADRQRIESHTLPLIRRHFPNSILGAGDATMETGRTHSGDRHVAQTAIAFAPCTLVTWNLRHFDRKALSGYGV